MTLTSRTGEDAHPTLLLNVAGFVRIQANAHSASVLSIRDIRSIRGRTQTAGLVPHSENFPKISKLFLAENRSTV
jgi:hypothetical protein